MKIVEAGWRIDDMPEGEEALAKLERLGRIAYKSEDKIDPGEKEIVVDQSTDPSTWRSVWKREPSSHKFVRMILQAERKAKMVLAAKKVMGEYEVGWARSENWPESAMGDLATELVSNIVDYMQQNPAHESVIEHCSATVVFTSNRGFTHEICRHRVGIALTQESTRYCDYEKGKFGSQITVIEQPFYKSAEADVQALAEWQSAMKDAEFHYRRLRQLGVPAQIARGVLPHDLKADIAVTANFREWLHIFALRDSPKAHPDMRFLMSSLHEEFRKRVPIIFD